MRKNEENKLRKLKSPLVNTYKILFAGILFCPISILIRFTFAKVFRAAQ